MVAVSGGADSLALLLLAAERNLRHGLPPPHAVTVDHGLRPASKEEALQVAQWAKSHAIPHTILTWRGRKPARNLQAQAREVRYGLIGDWMTVNRVQSLFTGHTLTDQAETFLLRLARGSGLDGLGCMAPMAPFPLPGFRDLNLVRPLLGFGHQRLTQTLQARKQPWLEDPSNHDDRFARVQVRSVLPALAAIGITPQRISHTTLHLRRARQAIAFESQRLVNSVKLTRWGYGLISAKKFTDAPSEVALRALSDLLAAIGAQSYPPRFEQTQSIYEWLSLPACGPAGRTVGGCRLARLPSGEILITREEGMLLKENPSLLLTRGQMALWDQRFEVSIPKSAPAETYEVRALGPRGLKIAGRSSTLPGVEPRRIAVALPVVWQDQRLVSAPLLGFHQEFRASIRLKILKKG